jgi:eukaryotic-like serine/threonine-protein kinase
VEYRYVARGAKLEATRPERMVGRCEMFDEIASGGMATIHLGRMVGAGGFTRTVAIKRLHSHLAHDQEFVGMFLDEARMVARIRHPNVVATLDLVEEEGDLFIVMEYVEGLNFGLLLRAARDRGERPPPGIAVRIVTDTLHGLHAAHDAHDEHGKPLGLVHRDVSPENILVGVDGFPRVLDFGVARALGRVTSTRHGQVKGKLAYMAPEQVLGESLDRRTDVFAASAVLWQALTGHRLFKAKNAVELAKRVLNLKIEPPSHVAPDVPKKFDGIVLRGLEIDPNRRWKSAAAMAEALEAVGGLSSNREVGMWVRRLGTDRLNELTQAVSALERKPVAEKAASVRKVEPRSRLEIPRSELAAAVKQAEAEIAAEADAAAALRGPPSPDDTGQMPIVTGSSFVRGSESGEYPVEPREQTPERGEPVAPRTRPAAAAAPAAADEEQTAPSKTPAAAELAPARPAPAKPTPETTAAAGEPTRRPRWLFGVAGAVVVLAVAGGLALSGVLTHGRKVEGAAATASAGAAPAAATSTAASTSAAATSAAEPSATASAVASAPAASATQAPVARGTGRPTPPKPPASAKPKSKGSLYGRQ